MILQVSHIACISLLVPGMHKLPVAIVLHWLGNLGNLGSNMEIHHNCMEFSLV